MHTTNAVPDIVAALDQLKAAAPNIESVSLVVSWFGTDLRAGNCQIVPGVENTTKVTTPESWAVNGVMQASRELIREVYEFFRPGNMGNPLYRQMQWQSVRLNFAGGDANEDFSALISELSPEKWKILRMLPVVNSNLEIDDRMFAEFVMRHRAFQKISRVEDNSEMLESYIMIDPLGRFYQNGQDTRENGYQYSPPILEVGALSAFGGMRFSADRYAARYSEVA